MAEMSEADLPGVRERIWCMVHRCRKDVRCDPALQKAEGAVVPQQESAVSSGALSLWSCMFGSFLQSVISTKTDRVPPPRLRALDACDYNVEVLVYGCDHDSDE